MWKVRTDEPDYAFLNDPASAVVNYYEAPVDLIARSNGRAVTQREMFINGEPGASENPHRNKQHAFHFTADNCIGCHACEAACSEKNDNPAHISFRSVGYVEGGTYPNVQRMNISMACNHCDDPVCLKGCPTGAYTKHAEYGAVLQDPDTCFGCGYCTWVCPYNAPQLDPVEGQVSKCNMCVDRLEVGLKPACVSACVGNALDFGVVENIPQGREQAKTHIPGFPDPNISKPNIRFQQLKNLPEEVSRTDGMPISYRKQEDGNYRPVVDQKKGKARGWNFAKLSSRENPLVVFTLAMQAAIGAFTLSYIGAALGIDAMTAVKQSALFIVLVAACVGMLGLGLLMSAVHLGKPLRFYRGFNNLRYSPVAREGLGVLLFMVFAGLSLLATLPGHPVFQSLTGTQAELGWLANVLALPAILAGVTGLYYMVRCYLIKARPFWNHWQTATSFVGSCFSLGAVLILLVQLPYCWFTATSPASLLMMTGVLMTIGLTLEGIGLAQHARAMNIAQNEGAASHYIQCTTFGNTYRLRNVLIAGNILLALALAIGVSGVAGSVIATLLLVSVPVTALIGRALFYVLVVPTTMPGAFFWKNKDFEEHARDIGLAAMPQVGVVALHH